MIILLISVTKKAQTRMRVIVSARSKEKQALDSLLGQQTQAWIPWDFKQNQRLVNKKEDLNKHKNIRITQLRKKSINFTHKTLSIGKCTSKEIDNPQEASENKDSMRSSNIFWNKQAEKFNKTPIIIKKKQGLNLKLNCITTHQDKWFRPKRNFNNKQIFNQFIQIKSEQLENNFRPPKFRLSFSQYCSSFRSKISDQDRNNLTSVLKRLE